MRPETAERIHKAINDIDGHEANLTDISCTPIVGGGFCIGKPCTIPEHLDPATTQASVIIGYDPATRTISLSSPPPAATETAERTCRQRR